MKTSFSFLQRGSIFFLIILSITAWYIVFSQGWSLAYNDAMSHLNISRFIIDDLQPGLAQLGGVWPPLSHLLPLVFIWNNTLWHTGLAATIFSMISYVVSVWALYAALKITTKSIPASLTGAAVFALNLNILYLQSTPLTEMLYMVFFCLSLTCFVGYIITSNHKYILALGLLGFFQVITRYDGWFVTALEACLLGYYELFFHKLSLKDSLAKVILFLFPVCFGIGLWLLWNTLIFKNPFYFATGPYSAHAQQSYISQNTALLTKHNLFFSLKAYGWAMVDNLGVYVFVVAIGGAAIFSLQKKYSFTKKMLVFLFLSSPILFNILSLYLGFSIINVPQLHWNPSPTASGQWFNVRYGIFIIPFAAFFIGIFAAVNKKAIVLAISVILLQMGVMWPSNIITLTDGLAGSSSFYNKDIAYMLQKKVKPQDTILLSISYFNPVAFKSGVDLRQIIHEGVQKEWQSALGDPEEYATWIVIANGDVGDPVYTALIKRHNMHFYDDYILAYRGVHANIYEIKNIQLISRR